MSPARSPRQHRKSRPKTGRRRHHLRLGDHPGPATPAAQRRQHRAAETHWLRQRGWHIKAIARHLNCHPKTIRRYLQRQLPLAAGAVTRVSKLDRFKNHLLERWNEGCHNVSQLFREVQPQGYEGRITALRVYLANLRRASGISAYSRQPGGRTVAPDEIKRPPTCRHLAWLTAQAIEGLDEEDQQALSVVGQINPSLKTAIEMAQRFAAMVCNHQPEPLDEWLEQAIHSELAGLRSFANGLRNDYEAVRAALSLTFSNGRTEGHVNRLKCVKRQMCGRGGLELLRRRVMAT